MKLANFAFAAALTLALVAGSASAGEQHATSKTVPQPTVMSDAQLDQIVGAGGETNLMVRINRTKAWENSGGISPVFQNKSQGQGNGASGSIWVINDNPSP